MNLKIRKPGLLIPTLAVCLAHVAVAASISFNQDFDSGSLNIEATTVEKADSDEPVITLGRRDVMSSGRWFYFDINGVEGKRPTFRVELAGNATRAHLAAHRYVYSLDGGETFAYFGNGGRADGHYVFTADEPFGQDTVRIAYALPYPVARTLEHARSLFDSEWVTPVPDANRYFLIDFTPGTENGGYRDDLGREIPRLPLIGFRITDSAVANGEKVNVVLTSGTHASEVTAHHVLEGKVNFLISGDPAAAEIRRRAVVHVYPQVNPEGRWAGYMRTAPEAPRVNVNRDWHDDPAHTQVRRMIEAITKDTGGKAAVVVDYHSMRGGKYEIWDEREDGAEQPYFLAFREARPDLGFRLSRNPNNVRQWGRKTLGAVEAFTLEIAFIPDWTESDYHELGRDSALGLLGALQAIQDGPETD